MLKRSEYVVMSLSFVFMLAIFMVISINYISDSAASNNDFTDKFDSSAHVADLNKLDKDYLIITGDDEVIRDNVISALNYAKKGYMLSEVAYTLSTSELKQLKGIIVTTSNLSSLGSMDALMAAVNSGANVFFAALPREGSDSYDAYCEALGIVSRTGEATIEGFQAFEGMYAQGEIICNDYPLTVEDIRVDATCRKYIFEYSSDPGADQSEMVPLLWRTVYGEGQVYVLNADFMEQKYGMGLCIAVLGCMDTEYAYPIVDAKVNYVDSFPFLSYENGDSMMKFYNRDSQSFIRDQVWPNLVTMMKDSDMRFTGLYYAYITDASMQSQFNGIYTQSFGSKLNHATSGKFPLNMSYHFVKHFDGFNDGLVGEESFQWGSEYHFLTNKGLRGISHADMIDLNRENIDGFDIREFYIGVVSGLRERGL